MSSRQKKSSLSDPCSPILSSIQSLYASVLPDLPSFGRGAASQANFLIVNADDWGRDRLTTDRTLDCVQRGGVTSVSAMVFMDDSERGAAIAREQSIDTGLHLNLTTPFSAGNCPARLKACQEEIARYLGRHRLAQVVFHPGLTSAFRDVVTAQLDEYTRLYGQSPSRLDGHHHMHLCANVLWQKLLPAKTMVRRNFSFEAGEKSPWNRWYRGVVDRMLARRHHMADYFFSLPPLEPQTRLERIVSLSREHVVEVEAHPVKEDEYRFLTGEGLARFSGHVGIEDASGTYLGSNA